MRPPPPGDEAVGTSGPALREQKRLGDRRQARLHIDDRAVLIEHKGANFAAEDFGTFHGGGLSGNGGAFVKPSGSVAAHLTSSGLAAAAKSRRYCMHETDGDDRATL